MKKSYLTATIIASLAASAVIGACVSPDIAAFFTPLGTIYVNLIKMVMVPLVFTSLVLGISSISDVKKVGRLGASTVGIFLLTTASAVVIGLVLSNIFQPGTGIAVGNASYEAKEFPSLLDNFVGIFPSNVLEALLSANMLQSSKIPSRT